MSQRASLKKIDGSSSRQSRQTAALNVRKAKKTDFMTRRRQLNVPAGINALNAPVATPLPHAIALFLSSPSPESLQDLSTSMASPLLSPNDIDAAITNAPSPTLFQQLSIILSSPESPQPSKVLTASILTNLTSSTSTPNTLIAAHSTLHTLNSILSRGHTTPPPPASLDLSLLSSALWILGNLAGDGTEARDAVHTSGALPLLNAIFQKNAMHEASSVNDTACLAVWVMCNLARGSYTTTLSFLAPAGPIDPSTLLNILSSLPPDAPLLKETAWLLTFLTSREDATVTLLNEKGLPRAVTEVIHKAIASSESNAKFALVPCIRICGNISTCLDGVLIASLLAPSQTPLVPSLCYLLTNKVAQVPSLATEAAWVAGAILCDAGPAAPYPSTVAASLLMPALLAAVTDPYANFELKQECLCSLWNAVAQPPPNSEAAKRDDIRVRDGVLGGLWKAEGMLQILCDTVGGADGTDSMAASLRLVSAILNRFEEQGAKEDVVRCGGQEALENVCEKAVGSGELMEWASDTAANLIDDFFDDYEGNEGGGDGEFSNVKVSVGGEVNSVFTFGVPTANAPFTFGDVGNAGHVPVQQQPPMGRGRGRGADVNKPSWMA